MSADFQKYLQSVCNDYQRWWSLYTITDVEGSKPAQRQIVPSLFDFDLMVQTVQPQQQEKRETPEKTERLPVHEGLRKYSENHVLLVGRPGSGKSTALARLLLEEAQKARSPLNSLEDRGEEELQSKPPFSRGVPQAGGSHFGRLDQIPVLVELRQYKTSVLDLIENFLQRHRLRLETAEIENLLFDGQFLLLVDGVNELPNEDARRDLKTFRQNYQHTPMIFTTRDLGVGGDLGIEKKLEMQPLTEEQMQEFVRAYLSEQGEEMLRRLGGRLREFGQTPLLLWMLCELFRTTGNVPPNLGLVFRCFAQSYDGKIKDDVPVSGESRRWWQELLQHLAFAMMQGETRTESRVTIERREAQAIFTKFLEGKVDYPASRAKEWLEDLLKHHLIQVASNEQIEFRHQLLQEYYAAECLLQQLPNISDDKLKRDYLNYLKWTEPLALMLALVEKEAQAVRVVQLALDVDLQLGARLAGEVKREFQEKTVGFIQKLDIHQLVKIEFLGVTRSEYGVTFLSHSLKDKDSNVHLTVVKALGEIGDSAAVTVLVQVLNHEDYDVRGSAAQALGKIGGYPAVTALINALNHKDYDVRSSAAQALEKIGNYAAVSVINQIVTDTNLYNVVAVSALIQALKDADFKVRHQAALALRRIGSIVVENLLINASQDLDLSISSSHSYVLGKIGNLAAIPVLIQALKDTTSLYNRRKAAYTLGNIGDSAAVPALIQALKDEDSDVRMRSAYALGKIGDSAAVAALIQTLKDEDSNVRMRTAEALDKIGISEILAPVWELRLTTAANYARNTISKIQERYKFYNHEIFHSPPVEEETKTKSETSKSSTYIIQRVGNLNTGDVSIHGNQIGIEHNKLNNKD